jgi:hypothetical protein
MASNFRSVLYQKTAGVTNCVHTMQLKTIMVHRLTHPLPEVLEQHMVTYLGLPPGTPVDWAAIPDTGGKTGPHGAINWQAILAFLQQLLPQLLALLGVLVPPASATA